MENWTECMILNVITTYRSENECIYIMYYSYINKTLCQEDREVTPMIIE